MYGVGVSLNLVRIVEPIPTDVASMRPVFFRPVDMSFVLVAFTSCWERLAVAFARDIAAHERCGRALLRRSRERTASGECDGRITSASGLRRGTAAHPRVVRMLLDEYKRALWEGIWSGQRVREIVLRLSWA